MEGCVQHTNMEKRLSIVEEAIVEIKEELKQKSFNDAQMANTMDMILSMSKGTQTSIDGLRDQLLNLVTDTLNKSREDATMFLKMAEKSEEKDRQHRRELEAKELEHRSKADTDNRVFMQKLVLSAVSALVTLLLAAWGIKSIINL